METNHVAPTCHDCHALVDIVEDNGTTLTVYCPRCGHCFGVEVVRNGLGVPVYWPKFRIALKGES